MAQTIDQMSVRFGADFKELLAEFKKAERASADFRQRISREMTAANAAVARINGQLRAALLGVVGTFGLARFTQYARDTLRWADDTGTLADRLGVTTDQVQELIFAGRELNVTSQEMARGLVSFWAKVSEAATGKGEGALILKQLGLDPAGFKNADDALGKIAAKIREFDRASQLTVTKTFFGDEKAAQFLGLLLGDMDRLKQKAHEVGVVVDADLIARGTELNKQIELLTDKVNTDLRKAFLDLGPVILAALEAVRLIIRDINNIKTDFNIKIIPPGANPGNTSGWIWQPGQSGFQRFTEVPIKPLLPPDVEAALEKSRADTRKRIARETPPPPEGTAKLNLDTAAASAMEGFDKQIAKLRIEAAALLNELDFGPAAASFKKLTAEFEAGTGKIKPTKKQIEDFGEALRLKMAREGLVALDQMRAQEIATAEAARLEALGQREAAEAVRIKFELTRRFGPEFAAQQEGWINQMARYKVATDEANQRMADIRQTIEGQLTNAVSGLGDAFGKFFESNKAGWEAMRNWASQTLNAIANEILRLTVVQPIAKGASGLLSGLLGGAGGAGGNEWPELLKGLPLIGGLFAEGGRPPIGVPSIVGEKGPEVFWPDTAGTIIPNRVIGGGTVNIYGAPDSIVRVAQLEGALQSLGLRVNRMDRGFDERAVNANIDARRRGGAAAAF